MASKVIVVAVFSALSTLFVALISLILGMIYSDYTELSIVFSELHFLLLYFLKLFGFFSLCLFLGILIKRSAFALGFLIVLLIGEQIAWGVGGELLAEYGNFATKTDAFSFASQIKGFFPLQASFNLLHEPFTRLSAIQSVAKELGEEIVLNYQTTMKEIGIALVYILLYLWGSLNILKKRDL